MSVRSRLASSPSAVTAAPGTHLARGRISTEVTERRRTRGNASRFDTATLALSAAPINLPHGYAAAAASKIRRKPAAVCRAGAVCARRVFPDTNREPTGQPVSS